MSKRTWSGTAALALAFLVSSLSVQPTVAQSAADSQTLEQYFKAVRGDIAAKRDSAMKTLIRLEGAEADTFWSLKDDYDKELKVLGKQSLKLTREFGQVYDRLTPDKAEELAGTFFDLETQRLELQQKYFKLMSEQVSPVVAVQYLQLQRQFETMADLKQATHAPLAVR